MTQRRKKVPARVQRALREEAGEGCAVPGCPHGHPQKCHIIDHQYVREHQFGGMIDLCGAHHDQHTYKELKNLDLYMIKAKLAFESDRYTLTELLYLDIFSRYKGSYFRHRVDQLCCIERLLFDGYVEEVSRERRQDGQEWATLRLTRYGRGLASAWIASGANPFNIIAPQGRPRPPRGKSRYAR